MEKEKQRKISVGVSFSQFLLDELDDVIQDEETSRSDFIRRAVWKEIKRVKEDRKNANN